MHNSDMDMAKGTPLNMTWDRTAYFHGAPGAPAELALFGPAPRGLFAPDRFVERPELSFGRYLDLLASELDQRFPVGKIRLIGFSAGARVALEVAHRLGARIDRIDLIAPAAPLQSGDFMAKMQGRAVFRLARHAPGLFPAVTWLQGRLGAVAPDRLYRMVFANAAGEDALLAADPAFRSAITDVMRRCLGPAARGYAREIIDFVRPWAGLPRPCACGRAIRTTGPRPTWRRRCVRRSPARSRSDCMAACRIIQPCGGRCANWRRRHPNPPLRPEREPGNLPSPELGCQVS